MLLREMEDKHWRRHSILSVSTLGFDGYIKPLKLYLQKFREAIKGEKGISGTVIATDGLSEEPTEEEAFTN